MSGSVEIYEAVGTGVGWGALMIEFKHEGSWGSSDRASTNPSLCEAEVMGSYGDKGPS